eukprot:TRINITY_DN2663_c1_g2_i2.p1 TRINITY_DN2663_c1_g2~~TRINITY_DN2663_c1_g2_i2.p1  ORF type:complete len:157 (-),score=55.69 TRINITY_DN2663_c1_g2_i2:13-483(-)
MLATFPYIVMFIGVLFAGWLSDKLVQQGINLTRVRKIIQSISFIGASIGLLLLCKETKSYYYPTFCFSIHYGAIAFSQVGYGINHLDLSPKYASILLGISNTAGTIPGVIAVTFAGFILDWSGGNWSLICLTSIFWYLFGLIIFLIFGSAEILIVD